MPEKPPPHAGTRRRWTGSVILIGLTALALAVIQSRREMDYNFRAWLTALTVLLGAGAQLLWWVLFSGWRWSRRLLLVVVVGLSVAGFRAATRVEGTFSGNGLPRFVWRWTPTPDERLAVAASDLSAPPASPVEPAAHPSAHHRFPQFLGPDRDTRITGVELDPDWATRPPRELWRRPAGLGWSGFAVDRGLAITQEQHGEEERVVACHLPTGAPAWSHGNPVRFREWQGGDGPRATPTIHSNRVYALGATGVLDCLDLTTGRPLWSVDVLGSQALGNLTWGKSSSPLVDDGRVIVTGGDSEARALLAYDTTDGRLLWTGGGDAASYASPAAATLAGRRQILIVGARTVAGHDPATGARLWEWAWGSEKWPKCSQPLVLPGNRILLSAGYGVGCQLIELAPAADGTLVPREVWKARTLKTQFNNVSWSGTHLFGLDDGFMACVDPATGQRMWKDGRYGSGQSLLVGAHLLIQSERGFVALVAADPNEFRELGRIPALDSKTWNTPALAGPYLLVRNDREAVCYELQLRPSAPENRRQP